MAFRTKIFSSAALLAAFAIFGITGFGQNTGTANQAGGQSSARRAPRAEKMDKRAPNDGVDLHGLDLTDEQKAQIKTIRESYPPDPQAAQELRTLMKARRSGTITPEQEERLNALQTQARERSQAIRTQIEGILTPEQLETLHRRQERRGDRNERRRENRQERREDRRNGDGTSTDGVRRQPGERGVTSTGGRTPGAGSTAPGGRRQGRP